MRSQHHGYWCPGAKAPGHQYPQCWLNIHCIGLVPYRKHHTIPYMWAWLESRHRDRPAGTHQCWARLSNYTRLHRLASFRDSDGEIQISNACEAKGSYSTFGLLCPNRFTTICAACLLLFRNIRITQHPHWYESQCRLCFSCTLFYQTVCDLVHNEQHTIWHGDFISHDIVFLY